MENFLKYLTFAVGLFMFSLAYWQFSRGAIAWGVLDIFCGLSNFYAGYRVYKSQLNRY